jgi:hypothetical protein
MMDLKHANTEGMASEAETEASIIYLARKNGCEEKVLKILARTKNILKGLKTEQERKVFAIMAIAEIHKTIGCVAALICDGMEIIPDDMSYKDEIIKSKKCHRIE